MQRRIRVSESQSSKLPDIEMGARGERQDPSDQGCLVSPSEHSNCTTWSSVDVSARAEMRLHYTAVGTYSID